MKKKLIAKFLLSTMIVPSLMSGSNHTYALPPENKAQLLFALYGRSNDSSAVGYNDVRSRPMPTIHSSGYTELWTKSIDAVSRCIRKENGMKILDLSRASFPEITAHFNAIQHCIQNRYVNAIKVSYAQMHQEHLLKTCKCCFPDSNVSVIYNLAETLAIKYNLSYFVDYVTLNFFDAHDCTKELGYKENIGNLICDSMLINKSDTLSVEGWIRKFDFFCKFMKGKFTRKMSKIKKIVYYGNVLTDEEKDKIRKVFRDNGITTSGDLEFIEDQNADPSKAHYTQCLYDPDCILHDDKGNIKPFSKLDAEALSQVALRGGQVADSKDIILSADDSYRSTGCIIPPTVSKKALEAEKKLKTIPGILDRYNYDKFLEIVSKRKRMDMTIETIDVAHNFATLRISTIKGVLTKLYEAGMRTINITNGDRKSDEEYTMCSPKNLIQACKNLGEKGEIIKITFDRTIGLEAKNGYFNSLYLNREKGLFPFSGFHYGVTLGGAERAFKERYSDPIKRLNREIREYNKEMIKKVNNL